MMQLLWPWSLSALLVVAAVAIWAIFRPGRRLVVVGSLSLWREALESPGVAAGRAKRVSTAWLLLLIGAAAAVCACARPVWRSSTPRRCVAIAIYPSAEIAAPAGEAELRKAAVALLDRLDAGDTVRMMLPAGAGGVSDELTVAQARRQIADVRALPIAAGDLIMPGAPIGVQHVYRFKPAPSDLSAAGPAASTVEISTALPMLTLEAVGAQVLTGGAVEVFISFRNQANRPWRGTLNVHGCNRSGEVVWRKPAKAIQAPPGQAAGFVLRCPQADILVAQAIGVGEASAGDGCAAYLVRRPGVLRKVALTGKPEPILHRFIRADTSLELVSAPADADLVIANKASAPAGKAALVINPPILPAPWRRDAELSAILLGEASEAVDDPVMKHVDLRSVALRRVRPWIADAAGGWKTLVTYRGDALIIRNEQGPADRPRRIYVTFDVNVENTNFATTNALVIFLANAVRYLKPAGQALAVFEYVKPVQTSVPRQWRQVITARGSADGGKTAAYLQPGVYRDASGRLEAVNLVGLRGARANTPALKAVAALTLPQPALAKSSVELWPILVAAAIMLWLGGWAVRLR